MKNRGDNKGDLELNGEDVEILEIAVVVLGAGLLNIFYI